MKSILVVCQYFYPEQFRVNELCTEWVKKGYKVTVLTGIPNYPEGHFFEGFGWFKKRKDTYNGADVIRIPLIARGKSSIGLILNYLSFVFFGFFWAIFTKQKADRVFCFQLSPLTQALIAVWFAKRRKIPCDIYVQDLWPENVQIVTGINSKAVIKPIEKMAKNIYKSCTNIYATSPSFVEKIRERVTEPQKVKYLPQYAEDIYAPTNEKSELIPDDETFKIAFTGNIGQAQGLEILPDTAQLLKGTNVRFVIVGNGRNKEHLISVIKEKQVEDMFLFVDRQSPDKIPAILASCQVAFISFMDNQLFGDTIPAKLQSYLACAKPILASATGETARIIEEAQCGICAPIGNAELLAEAIKTLQGSNLDEMSKNALKYSKEHFSKEKILAIVDEDWK